jgi:hypothetical protein
MSPNEHSGTYQATSGPEQVNTQPPADCCRVYRIVLTGTAPMIQNRRPMEHEPVPSNAQRGTMLEVLHHAYRFKNGTFAVPTEQIRRTIDSASRRVGRDLEESWENTVRERAFKFASRYEPLIHPVTGEPLKECEVHSGRYRKRRWRGKPHFEGFVCPKFPAWKVIFHIGINEAVLPIGAFRQILEVAGKRIGLGSMRPENDGNHGTFKIEDVQEC